MKLTRKKKRTPAKLRDVLKRAWKDYEQHGGIPHDQFWKESRPKNKRVMRTS
jgi:hypothetical protein